MKRGWVEVGASNQLSTPDHAKYMRIFAAVVRLAQVSALWSQV